MKVKFNKPKEKSVTKKKNKMKSKDAVKSTFEGVIVNEPKA